MKLDRFAQDAARFIKSLERMQGPIILLDGSDDGPPGLVILSHTAPTEPTPQPLLATLLGFDDAPTPLTSAQLARDACAREHIEVTAGRLGRWVHKLHLLQKSTNLEALIRSGTGALKRYQNTNIDARIERFAQTYAKLRDLHLLANTPDAAPLLPLLTFSTTELPCSASHALRREVHDALTHAMAMVSDEMLCSDVILDGLMVIAGFCGDEGAQRVAEETHRGALYTRGTRCRLPTQLAVACQPGIDDASFARLLECGDGAAGHWAARSTLAVGAILGVRAAAHVIEDGMVLLRQHTRRRGKLEDCGASFLQGCQTLSTLDRAGFLPEAMRSMREDAHGPHLTRKLIRVLREMLHTLHIDDLPGPTALWRGLQREGHDNNPAHIGQVLWQTLRPHTHAREETMLPRTRAHCRTMLTLPSTAMPGLHKLDKHTTQTLTNLVYATPPAHIRPLMPELIAQAPEGFPYPLRHNLKRIALTRDELRFMVNHHTLFNDANDLPTESARRKALIECVRQLAKHDLLEALDATNGWLIRLFCDDTYDPHFNMLTIARALTKGNAGESTSASQIHSFCHALQHQNSPLRATFDAWRAHDTAQAQHGAEIARLSCLFTDAPEQRQHVASQIARYFHHQSLLEEPERLSKNILKKLADPLAGYANQLAALATKLEQEDLPMTARAKLIARREKLERGESLEARSSRMQGARNLLEQSLAKLEARSLRHVLDLALVQVLNQLTGPDTLYTLDVLTPELRSVLAASQSEEWDAAIFSEFLTTAINHTPRAQLPANARWVRTARVQPGFDLERWEKGFSTQVSYRTGKLRIKTEHHMLRAAHMGTWFDTCLSLEDGYHAMSAFTHVLDANKHVVYVENARGEVVARKLIALSSQYTLLGYPLYTREGIQEDSVTMLVDGAIEEFASACNIALGHEGKPVEIRTVEGEGVYYDGVKPWHVDRLNNKQFPTPPEHWSEAIDDELEWAFCMARETKDMTLMRAVAWRMRTPWCDYAVADLIEHDPEAALRWFASNCRGWDPPTPIVHAIWRRGNLDAARRHELLRASMDQDDDWRALDFAFWNMPLESELLEVFTERLVQIIERFERYPARQKTSSFEHVCRNGVVLGQMRFGALLECLDRAIILYHRDDYTDQWRRDQRTYLLLDYLMCLNLSWLLHGADEQALCHMIRNARHEDMCSVVAMFCQDVHTPRVARALWARWKTLRKVSKETRRAWLSALIAQDEALRDLPEVDLDLSSAEVSSASRLRDIIHEEIARHDPGKTARRALARALDATQKESRARYNKKVDQD